MIFEVIGEVTDIETIALVVAFMTLSAYVKCMDQAGGVSSKELLSFALRMVRSPMLNYTGMRRMALARRK